MSYHLSEAYIDLYNPRVESNLDDNLRFIDDLTNQDIEEVLESFVWELQDYGQTLDEAIQSIFDITFIDVINEAYDIILESHLLSESRSQVMTRRKAAEEGLRKGIEQRKNEQAYKTGKSVNISKETAAAFAPKTRREGRLSRVTHAARSIASRARGGVISKVKAAQAGATGGMARAQKALGGAISSGKARLKQLLRTGAKVAGKGLTSAGRAISKAGESSASAGKTRRETQGGRYVVVGGERQDVPSKREKVGGVMNAVGRGLRKVGVDLRKGDVAGRKSERMRAKRLTARAERAERAKDTSAFEKSKPKALLPAKSSYSEPKQSNRRQEALTKIARAAEGKSNKGVRFSAPGGLTATKRSLTQDKPASRKAAASRFASKVMKEDCEYFLDYILNDIIREGYAIDYDTALDLFLQLEEYEINELMEDFMD
jgi:hypothetical protein